MFYFTKSPWWLKRLYPRRVWSIDTKEKILYLTFDDGPDPRATPFVLDQLKKHGAKATFFCIGRNTANYPELYQRIIAEGHATGNHTFHHLNGFKTANSDYISNVIQAASLIHSRLFRPPYGRLKSAQARRLRDYKIIMWDVLSGDFDKGLPSETCLRTVIQKSSPGSIIVFHDSEKSMSKIEYVLPLVLEKFSEKGYRFEKLDSATS
jgi:peptidoglycan/xylan/chitin deacetylase (PgdA/CDA1 family)